MELIPARTDLTTRTNPTARLAAVLLLVAALFASCGGADGGQSTSGGSSGPGGAACDLLGDGFVAGLLGDGFSQRESAASSLDPGEIAECDWRHPDGLDGPTGFYRVTVSIVSQSSIDDTIQYVFTEPVAGLGDEGWRARVTESAAFFTYEVKSGDTGYSINLIETFKAGQTEAQFDDVARSVFTEVLANS